MSSQAHSSVGNQEMPTAQEVNIPERQDGRLLDRDPDWEHFVAGAGASGVNIIATFPIFKLAFRQQVDGTRISVALSQLRAEGYRYLYRGVLPPLLQKGVSVSLMFGVYHGFQRKFNQSLPILPAQVNNTMAAIMAGSAEAILTPLERIQTLLTHRKHHDRFHNTFHIIRELRMYGIQEYYRGLTAILLRNGPSNAVFFGFRSHLKERLPPAQTPIANTLQDFLCGAMLGAFISTIFYPLAIAKMNMQKHVGGEFWGVRQTLSNVYTQRSGKLSKFYRGCLMNGSRAVVSWGIINASFEVFLSLLRHTHGV